PRRPAFQQSSGALRIAVGKLPRGGPRGLWRNGRADRLALVPRDPARGHGDRGPRHLPPDEVRRGGVRMTGVVEAAGISKWYGEVLGLNGFSASFGPGITGLVGPNRSEEHTSELQSLAYLVCRLLL